MQAALKESGIPSRPHAKTHKCAAIAKYQLATGSIGICCAKLSEAEAMVAKGVDKILMTTANPSKNKIRRAMALRKAHPKFIQAVDEEQNARDLSAAAKEAGVVADVVIDVAVGTRSGIPAADALRWPRSSTSSPTSSCAGCSRTTEACSTRKGSPIARSARSRPSSRTPRRSRR